LEGYIVTEEWRQIAYDGFEKYDVSSLGAIQNHKTGRTLSLSTNQYGVVWVGLVDKYTGRQKTMVVSRIVADHFVQGRSKEFNTPINVDGNRKNNAAANLLWRPRWFAVKFFHQFAEPVVWSSSIVNNDTDFIYEDSREAAQADGLLEVDVMKSVVNGSHVFPTHHTFSRL
jgi:hypothetical protein